jgi:hypothetical protein
MAVGIHGDGNVGVAEPLADHLGRDAGGQGRGRVAVPDVMQPNPGEAGLSGVLLEPPGEAFRVDGAAVRPGEHEARVLPSWSDRQPLFELPGPVFT